MYQRGCPVIFRINKRTPKPGPRARDVTPEEHGENYRYVVEKFWSVAEILADGKLLCVTRRGKEHLVEATDPRLRQASWWERWLYRERFPRVGG